jgi:DNA polymerase III delta subunit
MAELAPAYLIAGDDDGKVDQALAALRARAEREGGPGALESFSPQIAGEPPNLEGLLAAIPALSLVATSRFLLADHVDRLNAKELGTLSDAVVTLPPDLTLVLVARSGGAKPTKAKATALTALEASVKATGGEVITYAAPKARDLARRLVDEAGKLGFTLERDAAELLVARLGERTVRLANELRRLSLWAEGGTVTSADLESMIADTTEEVVWTLSDAVVERDAERALLAAERLRDQGESVTGLVWQIAKRLRGANQALTALESGRPAAEIERSLGMHPYAAKMLLRSVRGGSAASARAASCAIADLEWWTRGGSDYPDDVALTLAVRRAAGRAASSGG